MNAKTVQESEVSRHLNNFSVNRQAPGRYSVSRDHRSPQNKRTRRNVRTEITMTTQIQISGITPSSLLSLQVEEKHPGAFDNRVDRIVKVMALSKKDGEADAQHRTVEVYLDDLIKACDKLKP